jgi:dUTPase
LLVVAFAAVAVLEVDGLEGSERDARGFGSSG